MFLQSPSPPSPFFLPFLLSLFSISSFLPPSSSDASLQQYTDCSPAPFTCGNLSVNISYPFRLGSRPDYCGYPGFDLTCTNNSAMMIRINNKRYQVKGIDYSNRLLTIVDPDPDFVVQTCPQPYANTTLDPRRFEYSDRDQNLTVFLSCSSFRTPMLYSIDCLVNETAGAGLRSYYGIQNGSLAGLGGICGSTMLVPVSRTAAGLLMNGKLSFGNALREGFAVSWRAGRAWCSECVDSGGFCGFYSNSTSDRPCFCPSDLANGSCSAVGKVLRPCTACSLSSCYLIEEKLLNL